jgi:hypothetical protein
MNLFKTFLKPSESVMVSLATGAMVYGIYQYSLPTLAEAHQTEPGNINLDAGRTKAMWTSAALISGVFLFTHDPNVFMVGALSFMALEWSHRHANSTAPNTGKMVHPSQVSTLNQGYTQSSTVPDDASSLEYYG